MTPPQKCRFHMAFCVFLPKGEDKTPACDRTSPARRRPRRVGTACPGATPAYVASPLRSEGRHGVSKGRRPGWHRFRGGGGSHGWGGARHPAAPGHPRTHERASYRVGAAAIARSLVRLILRCPFFCIAPAAAHAGAPGPS